MNTLTAIPFSFQILAVLFIGLILGSFINVCIYRIPKNESIVRPRSHCPSCKSRIFVWDNIPVFSYFLLKGKCRQCGCLISTLYPIIETLTAFLLLTGFIKFGLSMKFCIWCIVGPVLLLIASIDIKHFIIPDVIVLPGILFGLIAGSFLIGLKSSAAGLLTGSVLFLTISQLYYLFRGRAGMGGGDIKFIAAIGALLGWKQTILVIFLSAFMGSLVGIFGLIKNSLIAESKVPFGAYLAGGTVITYFSGDFIINTYLLTIAESY